MILAIALFAACGSRVRGRRRQAQIARGPSPCFASLSRPLRPAGRCILLLALAYPAVLINIGHGQNGFLTAALLGGALIILDRRPILAGILSASWSTSRNSG